MLTEGFSFLSSAFHLQEAVFDYMFTHLGVDTDGCVDHPMVLTEAMLNPSCCRHRELDDVSCSLPSPIVCYLCLPCTDGIVLFAMTYRHTYSVFLVRMELCSLLTYYLLLTYRRKHSVFLVPISFVLFAMTFRHMYSVFLVRMEFCSLQ